MFLKNQLTKIQRRIIGDVSPHQRVSTSSFWELRGYFPSDGREVGVIPTPKWRFGELHDLIRQYAK